MVRTLKAAPKIDVDLFGEASLRNPIVDYRRLRDEGPVVRPRRPEVRAGGRFADVQAALWASNQLISGEGVGFSEALAECGYHRLEFGTDGTYVANPHGRTTRSVVTRSHPMVEAH